jgi:hypothetical protein
MVEIAEMTTSDTLKLPAEVASRFRPSDRFIILVEGDTLQLKRITPSPVTGIVAEAPEGEPMLMDEINEIFHEVRRQQRAE